MIVKNEERFLPRCLDSVRELHPEIILVDTGSTDGTPEVAARYGATIAAHDFSVVDFAAARNEALRRASGRWILALDADETLHPSGIPAIEELIRRGEDAGYYFARVNHHAGSAPPTTDYAVRLFPNRRGYRYRYRVHETIEGSILAGGGRLLRTGIRIDHDFTGDPGQRREKNLLYIAILNEEIAADPGDDSRLDFLAAEYHQLGMFAQAAEIAERIARVRPHDPRAHLHAGIYHLVYQSDRPRARADFLEALRLQPGYAEALSFLQLADEQPGIQI